MNAEYSLSLFPRKSSVGTTDNIEGFQPGEEKSIFTFGLLNSNSP